MMRYTVTRGRFQEYEDETGERFWSCSELLHTIDPNVYAYVDDQVMVIAQARGVDLHKQFFYLMASLLGLCQKPEPPNEFMGYIRAMEHWIHDRQPYPLLLEETSINRKWQVAGTKDFKGVIEKKIEIVDIKTGGPQRIHEVQLNCYKTFDDAHDVARMRTLYVRSDGTYDDPLVYVDPLHLAALENAVVKLQCEAQLRTWRAMT